MTEIISLRSSGVSFLAEHGTAAEMVSINRHHSDCITLIREKIYWLLESTAMLKIVPVKFTKV